jgi:hypothetical protein
MTQERGRAFRLRVLRHQEFEGTLTAAESDELASIYAQMDAEEMEALRPALERSQREQAEMRTAVVKLEAEGIRLNRLIAEGTQLLQDAQSMVRELQMRHEAQAGGDNQSRERLIGEEMRKRMAAFAATAQTLGAKIPREGA